MVKQINALLDTCLCNYSWWISLSVLILRRRQGGLVFKLKFSFIFKIEQDFKINIGKLKKDRLI